MRFALVIPALNEQEAIAGTLRRALAARHKVLAQTPVTEMKIVFVNDGSTDGTQQIVEQPDFDDVVKVRFERNQGYGAAIKAGFQATDCDLVGFIDADGTCEPDFCVDLINELVKHDADAALARRLEPNTQMPLIRKVGNRIFATLLGVVSGHTDITDTASGFRVLKRNSLKLMSPLPDGLHFTPAMSCICLLDPRLKIVEVPGMHYKEREGRSKLKVVKDGFRFLWTIIFSACCYAPIKTMMGGSAIVAALAVLWVLVLSLAGASSELVLGGVGLAAALVVLLLLANGLACHELNYLLIGPRRRLGPVEAALQWLLNYRRLILGGAALVVLAAVGLGLLALRPWPPGPNGKLALLCLVFLAAFGGAATIGGVIVRVIWAVGEKQKALIQDLYAVKDAPHPQPASVAGAASPSPRAANAPAVVTNP